MPSRKNKYDPEDLSRAKRGAYAQRASKTHIESFGRPLDRIDGVDYFESLPKHLKASDLLEFLQLVARARRNGLPFHLLLGAHTIKVGLSPVFIDLLRRGIATGLSFNSAGVIHDLELAFFGGTSEDVQQGLLDGSFGMAAETGDLFAEVAALAKRESIGLGEATGRLINERKAPYRELSFFAAAESLGLPATVHAGIGTDIVAQHPNYDAAAVGAASHIDFRILCSICRDIDRGGALANIGSAVILPEVFLKALTVARNIHGRGDGEIVTANFDMITHYRPTVNVVNRPTFPSGKGFNFVGHHELMVPLLAWGLRRACNT